jgi:hypothetical protein
MSLRVRLSAEGVPQIWSGERLMVEALRFDLPQEDGRLREASPWECFEGIEHGEACPVFQCVMTENGSPLLTLQIRSEPGVVSFSALVEKQIRGLRVADSFEAFSVAFPRIVVPASYRCFLTTYGLGPSGNGGVGGYWPEAKVVPSTASLPSQAFSPLVLFDEHSALAIAPTSQFLTSSLIADHGDVVRTLHGSIDVLEAGTRLETVFVEGVDIADALLHAGDFLLARGGKRRPDPRAFAMTSKLGWWNAYGGYYTEPIHPLNEETLVELIRSLREQTVPVEYVGLDLWYPYKYIGQALRFEPDPSKYPHGVRPISDKFDLPMVLHLSALSDENEYRADGSNPDFYRQVARELRSQGAVVAWHDWLRTQQHLSPQLRGDTTTPDAWFRGMAEAMAEQNINVLTCMHTMGMALGSTALPNIISARSSIDYLFAQPEALDTLEQLGLPGFRDEATPLHRMRRQNLLVGFTYYALGLLPFYDLFLTRWQDRVGGASPRAEAVLRALSCGPVGIGDGPGLTDTSLVSQLLSSEGDLLQPDHPPYPDTETLGNPIEIYRTERKTSSARWEYVLVLNTTAEDQSFDVALPSEEVVIWDGMRRRVVKNMCGVLQGGEIAYFLLAPLIGGIAPIGFGDKLLPTSTRGLIDARWTDGWELQLGSVSCEFSVWADVPIVLTDQDGKELKTQQGDSVVVCSLGEGVSSLHIARR